MSTTLQDTTNAYRAALGSGCDTEFDLAPADRTGLPVVSVGHRERSGGSPVDRAGVGYGVDIEHARVGAWGELVEEVLLSRHMACAPRRRASHRDLVAELGAEAVVDPVSLVLPAGCDHSAERVLDWVPARRHRTGEEVWVPLDFAASDAYGRAGPPADGWLTTPVTNGLGAGDTRERAITHALLELLQRDGNATAHRAMCRGVVIDLDTVTDPITLRVLDRLRGAGVEVLPKLASAQFGMVDVHVVGIDTDPDASPLTTTACGEAAHPDRETALRKALLEYAGARARKVFAHGSLDLVARIAPAGYLDRVLACPVARQEPRALRAMAAWSSSDADALRSLLEPTVLSRRSTVAFSSLPTVATGALDDPAALLVDLLERLADLDVLVIEAGEPGAYAVKVLVPGLEVETMSYGRIGGRGVKRLIDHDVRLAGLGAPPHAGARMVHLTDSGRALLGDDRAWFDVAAADRVIGELYPLYREPDRHAVARMAEGVAR